MSRCCTDSRATAVAFEDGVVLHRCPAHEQQRWTLDGLEVTRTEAMARLSALFTAARGRRGSAPARRPQAPRSPQVVVLPNAVPTDERLTALLRSRGLAGSWSVALPELAQAR